MGRKIQQSFYQQDALVLAPQLLGQELVSMGPDGKRCSGWITELEVYLDHRDAASHAFNGPTQRSSIMFGRGGVSYVYLSYGMHHCFNVVTGPTGQGQAILIRGLRPKDGINLQRNRRNRSHAKDLCSGPGKLTQALGIDICDNGADLSGAKIWLESARCVDRFERGPRIGISKAKDLPYRYWCDVERDGA